MKVYAFIKLHLAYHIDSTTLANENCQLIPEPEGSYSEDPENFVAGLSEAPNLSSEGFINISDPSPASEGKPRTYPITFFTLQPMIIYLYLCIKSRNCNETLDAYF
jgi:hypothetical protein